MSCPLLLEISADASGVPLTNWRLSDDRQKKNRAVLCRSLQWRTFLFCFGFGRELSEAGNKNQTYDEKANNRFNLMSIFYYTPHRCV